MHALNSKYAKYYNQKHNRVGYVFRDRYKSEGIYTEKHLYNCIKYIYNNPVKAGICKHPSEYPYSNYYDNTLNINFEEDSINYNFIEIDEDKDTVKEIINEYLGNRTLNEILEDENALKQLIFHLKINREISYRKIEKELGIRRKKLSSLIN